MSWINRLTIQKSQDEDAENPKAELSGAETNPNADPRVSVHKADFQKPELIITGYQEIDRHLFALVEQKRGN